MAKVDVTNTTTRLEVYDAINSEREYQEQYAIRDSSFSTGDYITMMKYYVDKLPGAWATEPGEAPICVLDNMRKIAAIAVQCMEVYGVRVRSKEGLGVWGTRSELERRNEDG